MKIKRTFYIFIILFLTFISVYLIIYDKKELAKNNNIYYKQIHTIKLPEELKEVKPEEINEKNNDHTKEIRTVEENKKQNSTIKSEVFSNQIMAKKHAILSNIEINTNYDEDTQRFLIYELNEGIKRAKLDQFEKRLSSNNIKDLNIDQVKSNLSKEDKAKLSKIIDKLGTLNGLKLIKILDNGITSDEQKEIHDLLKDKLKEEEIISLNDILGDFTK
ncbi:MAG: hypothetical protein ACTHVE_07590 [Senegalia sp. (in: firmicutes)]|uniref:hypothetical protein n=1 Tax=Senegalia sp. (in: firmicutes) TaxID=1924098 RepID=UPI003F9D49A6